jgi:hypothetical protein
MGTSASASKLLIQEPPLQVLPGLAVAIGLNEAIILQQLHFLLLNRPPFVFEGRGWIIVTLEGWHGMLPWWSEHTIRRALERLEGLGLVLSCQPDGFNRATYYAIDYDKLDGDPTPPDDDYLADHLAESSDACGQNGHFDAANLATSLNVNKTPEEIKKEAGGRGGLPPLQGDYLAAAEQCKLVTSALWNEGRGVPILHPRKPPSMAAGMAKSGLPPGQLVEAYRWGAGQAWCVPRICDMAAWASSGAPWLKLHQQWRANCIPLPRQPAGVLETELEPLDEDYRRMADTAVGPTGSAA